MEIAVIFILAIAFSENHNQQEAKLEDQAAQIEQLQETVIRLATSHSSVAARDKYYDGIHETQIEALKAQVEFLNKRIHIPYP